MPALEIRQDEIGRYDPSAYLQIRKRLRPAPRPHIVGVRLYDKPIGPPAPRRPQRAVCTPNEPSEPPPKRKTFAEIRNEELAKARISLIEFNGESRRKELVLARRIIWTRAVNETGLSIAAIGRFSGDKDHTTVIRAIIRHREETTGQLDPRMERHRVYNRRRHHEARAKRSAACAEA
jgi:hypothetical protein